MTNPFKTGLLKKGQPVKFHHLGATRNGVVIDPRENSTLVQYTGECGMTLYPILKNSEIVRRYK